MKGTGEFKKEEILFFRFVMGFVALFPACPHQLKAVSRRQEARKWHLSYRISQGQRFTVMGIEPTWKMWYAGESALSQISGLSPPGIAEMAIYKGDEIVDQFDIVDERLADNELFAKVQLWKYDPLYFARNGTVDPVSLACSNKY